MRKQWAFIYVLGKHITLVMLGMCSEVVAEVGWRSMLFNIDSLPRKGGATPGANQTSPTVKQLKEGD